jgi:hypothetical protein
MVARMSYFRVIAPLEGVHQAEAVGWGDLQVATSRFANTFIRGEEGAVGQEGRYDTQLNESDRKIDTMLFKLHGDMVNNLKVSCISNRLLDTR